MITNYYKIIKSQIVFIIIKTLKMYMINNNNCNKIILTKIMFNYTIFQMVFKYNQVLNNYNTNIINNSRIFNSIL